MRGRTLLILGGAAGALALIGALKMSGDNLHGKKWDYLLPEMKHKALQLLAQAKAAGLDVMFEDGWRSPGREAQYQKQKTSELKDQYNSYHTWGAAVDIVFRSALGQPEWPDASDPRWQELGKIGKALGLEWGGDWHTFKDMAHFQLPSVSVAQLRNTYGTNYLAWLRDNGAIA